MVSVYIHIFHYMVKLLYLMINNIQKKKKLVLTTLRGRFTKKYLTEKVFFIISTTTQCITKSSIGYFKNEFKLI